MCSPISPVPPRPGWPRSFAEGELQELFDGLQPDDAADLLEELPANLVDPHPPGRHARSGAWR